MAKGTGYAWIVKKPGCNCVVFARLVEMRKGIPLASVVKKGVVDRVPVPQAKVVVCRCGG